MAESTTPWSTTDKMAAGALAVGVFASLFAFVHPWFEPRPDASMYISTARSILDGDGYTYLGSPFYLRPPGLALVIAPVLATFGTNFRALNALMSLFGAAGVFLLFAHQRPRLGSLLALLVAAAVWLNPGYQRLCNQVMSDIPGLALVLACLLLSRRADRKYGWDREFALGFAIGLSVYFRSIALLLIPAIALARVSERWVDGRRGEAWTGFALRRLALFAVVALAVALPWTLHVASVAGREAVDQTATHSYGVGMLHVDRADPNSPLVTLDALLRRVPERAPQILASLGDRLRKVGPMRGSSIPLHPLNGGIGLLLLTCLVIVALKRRAASELLAIGVLLVLGFWYSFLPRLVLPIYVFGLAAAAEVVRDLGRRVGGERVATGSAAAALALLAIADFAPRRDWEQIAEEHQRHLAFGAAVADALEPDARIGSAIGWHKSVYLDRPVYSLSYAIRRRGNQMQAAEALIDKYALNTIVLDRKDAADRPLIPYFTNGRGAVREVGSAVLVRVRP